MYDLGRKVSDYRKAKGFTVKTLAENLCDESTIYRLEQGKQLPRLEILNDICTKLEMPFKALFPLNEEVEELKRLCREHTYNEDYLSLKFTIDECKKVLNDIDSVYTKEEFRKFIQWQHAILLHKNVGKPLDALRVLNSLANLKTSNSELDFNILNSIALINLSIEKVEVAHRIYNVINKKLQNHIVVEDPTLTPRVGYNYAHTLFKLERYLDALDVINKVLYYLESHQSMYILGKVYHLNGLLLKKCGYLGEAAESFQNAILGFTLTKDKSNINRAEKDLANIIKVIV
ncbi:helix-turn-helix domain-containing protein [Psychrobacillus sp. FSL K6-4615]|uniref:helix-turn-helix domain-containing protein n=1 Tax=Psychrobacillus sp. FSL K6-4615 TaxID=2921551 RepID=UPI0030F5CFC5